MQGHVLTPWETLNKEMDEAAKVAVLDYQDENLQSAHIDGEMWSVWHHGRKITTNFKETIYSLTSGQDCHNYWIHKDRFLNAPHDVDWEVTAKVMKSLSVQRKIWCCKLTAGIDAVSVNMVLREKNGPVTTYCPARCGEKETTMHLCRCADPAAVE